MGRDRKPTALHNLEGTRPGATNRDRNEPKGAPIGDPPEHWHGLDEDVRELKLYMWAEIKSKVPDGVLTEGDAVWLEQVVDLLFISRFGVISSSNRSLLLTALGKLGMNPVERSKVALSGGDDSEKDDWDDF